MTIEARGGCHCGAVRFAAQLQEPPVPALDCNCSICRMTGFVHIIVPHDGFEILSGREQLTSYRFGTGAAEHLFCSVCGVKSFYQPRSHPDSWSVNGHCLDQAVDLAIEPFDGRNWEQAKAELDGGNGGG
ncbi:MAG TPA: GFA family protein [Sphingomicrobium sp.]|nr:GFA family protein [Sphingomicrobium sp.]